MDNLNGVDNLIVCSECKNSFEVAEGKKTGEIIECPFCGIEYKITGTSAENGNYTLEIFEEEK